MIISQAWKKLGRWQWKWSLLSFPPPLPPWKMFAARYHMEVFHLEILGFPETETSEELLQAQPEADWAAQVLWEINPFREECHIPVKTCKDHGWFHCSAGCLDADLIHQIWYKMFHLGLINVNSDSHHAFLGTWSRFRDSFSFGFQPLSGTFLALTSFGWLRAHPKDFKCCVDHVAIQYPSLHQYMRLG